MTDVRQLLSMSVCMELQEGILRTIAAGRAFHSENAWLLLPEAGGWLKLMSGAVPESQRAAAKVSIRLPELPAGRNLGGVIVLFDTDNGSVRAIVDAVFISAIRTAATGGVASRILARPDSEVVGVIGSGVQARWTLAAVCEAMPSIQKAFVYSRRPENRERFCADMASTCGISISACDDPKQAASSADILITGTNASEPVFESQWLHSGVHLLFMGSKNEAPVDSFAGARIVVDSLDLAMHDGKVAAAIDAGVLTQDGIHGELGDILIGKLPGRDSAEQTTIYDCSGLAEQDLVCADYVCDRAESAGVGLMVSLSSDLLG